MQSPGAGAPAAAPPLLNIANVLTVVRILMVPLFLVVLFMDGGHDTVWRIVALAVFAAAIITDRFDGQIARSRGLVTEFGKLMDPIADKALVGAALIGLSILGDLAWWITIAILVRELGITLLRFAVIADGVIPASRGGKLKTALQSVALMLYIAPLPDFLHWPVQLVMWAAVAVTVITGIDYVQSYLRKRSAKKRQESQ